MQVGRPSKYNEQIANELCTRIATSSHSLRRICSEEGMPTVSTVFYWLRSIQGFSDQYARAKQEQADMMIEDMLEISDDSSGDTMMTDKGPAENREWVNRSRLRVDTRKWIASKLKPKVYGDKIDVTSGDTPLNSGINNEQFQALLAAAKNNATTSDKGK